MNFREATKKDKASFEKFVNSKKEATCMQMWQWADFRNKLGKKFYKRLIVEENNDIQLTATVALNSFRFLGNVLYIPQGPVWSDSEALKYFSDKLCDYVKRRNYFAIVCDPRVQENSGRFEELIKVGFKFTDKAVQPKCTIFIDLTKDKDQLISDFSRTTRYNIRYAKRKGVKIKHFTSPQDVDRIDEFYKLLIATRKRKYFHVQTKEYFQELWKEFSREGRANLFEAWVESDHVGTIITLNSEVWASSLFSASCSKHSKLKPMYLTRWESILDAKSKGCNIYDFFGATDSNDKNHPFYYTTRHKLGFEKSFKKFAGTFEIVLDPVKYRAWKLLEKNLIFKFYEDTFLKIFRNANK